MAKNYKQFLKKKLYLGLLLTILLFISIVISLNTGSIEIDLKQFTNLIFHFREDQVFTHILINIRLPRIFNAILAGASLSISGAILQNLLKNPLASPFTLGISHGAVFGAALAITLKSYIPFGNSSCAIIIFAFVFAIITMLIILLITAIKGLYAYVVILAGVALNSLFASLTMLLQYFSTDEEIAAIVFWTFGDLNKTLWSDIYLMSLIIIPIIVYQIFISPKYNITIWDDDTAMSLGINIKLFKTVGVISSCLITAAVISFMGIIGFIGLISPHIIRLVIGNDHRFLLIYSAILGSIILLLSDMIGRVVLAPAIIPVGIITSLLGVPIFLYILLRNKGIS
ncbi:MAG: iron ABC transporter permease [Deferribacterota bacterium]|nr:iron ABC transporter permease [Deferribacterota bacterium]